MHPAVGLLFAYLLGSIPAAFIAGKVKGVDLRKHGSGNLGATNVFRVLGAPIGLAVFTFDAAKGAAPVLYFPRLFDVGANAELWAIAYGVAAIAGHVRPIFLLGRGGGKGVATAAGVFFALAPLPLLISTAVFALTLWTTGYVSLSSLMGALVLTVSLLLFKGLSSVILWVGVAVTVFVFWTHRANIGRLRRGEEHSFKRKKNPPAPEPPPSAEPPQPPPPNLEIVEPPTTTPAATPDETSNQTSTKT